MKWLGSDEFLVFNDLVFNTVYWIEGLYNLLIKKGSFSHQLANCLKIQQSSLVSHFMSTPTHHYVEPLRSI